MLRGFFFGGGGIFPLFIPPLALGGKWSPARLPEKQAVGKKEWVCTAGCTFGQLLGGYGHAE